MFGRNASNIKPKNPHALARGVCQLKELCQILSKHTDLVVECFAKLTDGIHDNIYIQTEEAKTILKTGLNSTDTIVFENAERALDNLLRANKMEFMDFVIDKHVLEI